MVIAGALFFCCVIRHTEALRDPRLEFIVIVIVIEFPSVDRCSGSLFSQGQPAKTGIRNSDYDCDYDYDYDQYDERGNPQPFHPLFSSPFPRDYSSRMNSAGSSRSGWKTLSSHFSTDGLDSDDEARP
jgi:hypothetical protein